MSSTLIEDLWFGDGDDASAESAAAASMVAHSAKVVGLRPFPAAVHKIIQLSRDPSGSSQEIAKLIEADASFAARVLRLINSAAMATRVRSTSIPQAVRLAGLRTIGEMAAALAALQMFEVDSGKWGGELKEHCSSVAAVGRHLAVTLGLPADDVYTCGLMHDLGKLFLLQEGDDQYPELLAGSGGGPDDLHIAERERYGYDHAVLAAHVLAEWKIPEPVPRVVAYHHQPARAMVAGGEVARLVALVRCADAVCYHMEREQYSAAEAAERVSRGESAQYLGLRAQDLEARWIELQTVANESRLAVGGRALKGVASPDQEDKLERPGEPSRYAPAPVETPQRNRVAVAIGAAGAAMALVVALLFVLLR